MSAIVNPAQHSRSGWAERRRVEVFRCTAQQHTPGHGLLTNFSPAQSERHDGRSTWSFDTTNNFAPAATTFLLGQWRRSVPCSLPFWCSRECRFHGI